MSVVPSATFPPAGGHALPLKLRLGDGGSRAAGSDTCTGSDRDGSDTASDGAAEPWPAVGACLPLGLRLPPGLGPPPGLCREPTLCAAAPAGRTALRSQAEVYSPLRSQAEAFVPKCLALAGVARPRLGGAGPEASKWTTVMIRNVPLSYTCDRLIDLLESMGFSKWVDFVYVPIKRTETLGVGYAFLNLTSPERAEEFMLAFEGFDGWASSFSKTACSMRWSNCQGLSENVSRYRNSPMMSEEVPAFYKPVLLKDGVRIEFPKPTKQLRTLRRRKGKQGEGEGEE